MTYNPNIQIDKQQWLEMDEAQRIAIVETFHAQNDEDLEEEAKTLHASFHVIVENQIAQNVTIVEQTIAKLIRQGIDRHEAIHAISAIMSEDILNAARGEGEEFTIKKFRKKFEKITAKRWRKGQY